MARFAIVRLIPRSFAPVPLTLILVAFVSFLYLPAQAQLGPVGGATATPIPGVGHDYIGDLVDTVSPADGSVSVRIKTPVPSGRGISVPFSFSYDSNGVWQPFNISGTASVELESSLARYLSQGGWTYGLRQPRSVSAP
jgi:hypothetical protein